MHGDNYPPKTKVRLPAETKRRRKRVKVRKAKKG